MTTAARNGRAWQVCSLGENVFRLHLGMLTCCRRCCLPTATSQCTNNQPFPCPADLTYYAYPDYENANCNTYYRCQRGVLTQRVCPAGTKFDSTSLRCQADNGTIRFFCQQVTLAYSQIFGASG